MREFKFLRPEPLYWRTAMGEYELITGMSGEHIFNVMIILKGDSIPNPYMGKTRHEWLSIFEQELRNRQARWERWETLGF